MGVTNRNIPILERTVYGKRLVYMDNAATSQKPENVLALQDRLYRESNANAHRAVHRLSGEATEAYEAGREAVRSFINAEDRENVVFTSGTTASLNLLASCFSEKYLGLGDKVLVTDAEHHSNLVPWQTACARKGAELKTVSVNDKGEIPLEDLERSLDSRVKLLSLAHISNVLGIVNPIKEIVEMAHSKGIPVAVDGAQGIVHGSVDVRDLDCDFYAFSGHKIYAPEGIGVLYGKKHWLEDMPPYMGGGDMVDTVTLEKTTFAPLPLKYEAGTQNFIAASCFKPALEYASDAEFDKDMVPYLVEELERIDGLKIYGRPDDLKTKAPLLSFTVEGAHPEDMAQILDKMGIAVRSGLMCAEPLVRRFSDSGMLRISLAPYNTLGECEYFVESLHKTLKMLGR